MVRVVRVRVRVMVTVTVRVKVRVKIAQFQYYRVLIFLIGIVTISDLVEHLIHTIIQQLTFK